MNSSLEQLVQRSIGIQKHDMPLPHEGIKDQRYLTSKLSQLLQLRNGMYCFRRSLLIRSYDTANTPLGVLQWNAWDEWENVYRINSDAIILFAENIWGEQYGISNEGIVSLDLETGDLHLMSSNLDSWASTLLQNPYETTGLKLLEEWEQENGALRLGIKLIPKLPFVLGGAYAISNLVPVPEIEAIEIYKGIAVSLRD